MNNDGRIVFFDGECGFCNRTVRRLLSIDKKRKLKFAPLQGVTASRLLPMDLIQDPSTLVYYRNDRKYVRSEAAARLLADIVWYGKIAFLIMLMPRFLRDGVYNWVAKNRHHFANHSEQCVVPDESDRERFLK